MSISTDGSEKCLIPNASSGRTLRSFPLIPDNFCHLLEVQPGEPKSFSMMYLCVKSAVFVLSKNNCYRLRMISEISNMDLINETI